MVFSSDLNLPLAELYLQKLAMQITVRKCMLTLPGTYHFGTVSLLLDTYRFGTVSPLAQNPHLIRMRRC